MAIISIFLQLLLSAVTVSGTPLQSRGTVPNDEIVGLAQAVPSGTEGSVYLAYQPYLDVINGCVPFPAVDINGNTNEGLPITGTQNSGCTSSLGQIYARAAPYNNMYAVMYSWYMPKDEPSYDLGHRHDWEGVIVWLSSGTSTSASNILAVCPSAHGGWDCSQIWEETGSNPWIFYISIWPIDHSCALGTSQGGTQPLIAWESLPTAALNALQTTDFGSATVPFRDANFTGNLAAATF